MVTHQIFDLSVIMSCYSQLATCHKPPLYRGLFVQRFPCSGAIWCPCFGISMACMMQPLRAPCPTCECEPNLSRAIHQHFGTQSSRISLRFESSVGCVLMFGVSFCWSLCHVCSFGGASCFSVFHNLQRSLVEIRLAQSVVLNGQDFRVPLPWRPARRCWPRRARLVIKRVVPKLRVPFGWP